MTAGLPGILMYFGRVLENMMKSENETLDQEWVDLILEALDMGISVNEIKTFFAEKAGGLDSMIG